MTTHFSPDNTLPKVEQTPQRQNSESGNPINKLNEAIADIASQQRPPTSSAVSKPTTRNTLIFDGKNEKLERIENVFQTMLKNQLQLTDGMKVNQFHSHFQKNALQTFRNFNASKKRTLEDVLIIFGRKCVRTQSQAAAEQKWHELTSDPNTKSLSDFLVELHECAERAFGPLARQMIDSLEYINLPSHLKWSINPAYIEIGTNEPIVTHLKRELKLSGLETDGESPIPTMTTTTTTLNKQT